MADDTSAALIAQLDVKFDQLASNMKRAMTVFDNGGRALEKRQKQIKKNLSDWAIDFSGIGGINKALVGLTGAAVVGGITSLVKKSLDAASAIGDVAQQAGVGVEFLQKLRFASSQTGGSFDLMDTALTTLNKTFGDFVNTGAGKGAQTFKTLGIDKLINAGDVRTTEQLFDVLVAKIGKFPSEAQKAAFAASVFGKEAGPKMLQLLNQGAAGIAQLEAQAVSLGVVLSDQTVRGAKEANDKLDALFNVIKAEGIAAVANLAPEIANLAQKITNSLPDLVVWVEKWSDFFGLIELDPMQKMTVQIADTAASLKKLGEQRKNIADNPTSLAALFGPSLGEFDTLIEAETRKLDGLKQSLAAAQGKGKNGIVDTEFSAFTNVLKPPALKINDIAGQAKAEADARKAEQLQLRRAQFLAQTVVDTKTAQAALQAAEDETQVQLLKGSADYYAARKKQIEDDYNSEVELAAAKGDKQLAEINKQGKDWKDAEQARANVSAEVEAQIAAAGEKRKQALDEAGPDSLTRAGANQAKQIIQGYADEAQALGLATAAAAKLAFVQGQLNDAREKGITLTPAELAAINAQGDAIAKAAQKAHDANEAINRDIQVSDELRQGLEDVGAAGLQGFSSMADAIKNFLNQLAELILRLYVLKPLLKGLGEQGTGGLFNGFLNLFGAGDLGINTTAAIAANPLLFDEGGYTGAGGKNQPAGIVHAGEGVLSQDDMRALGGPKGFSALRAALRRGYASGGVVGLPTVSTPTLPRLMPASRGVPGLTFNIDARYATKGTAEEIQERLMKAYPAIVRAAVQESNRQFPLNLSNTIRDRA